MHNLFPSLYPSLTCHKVAVQRKSWSVEAERGRKRRGWGYPQFHYCGGNRTDTVSTKIVVNCCIIILQGFYFKKREKYLSVPFIAVCLALTMGSLSTLTMGSLSTLIIISSLPLMYIAKCRNPFTEPIRNKSVWNAWSRRFNRVSSWNFQQWTKYKTILYLIGVRLFEVFVLGNCKHALEKKCIHVLNIILCDHIVIFLYFITNSDVLQKV